MANISVVVPVYNVESYLHRCIDSILAQTCQDFNLILVNDGSGDNSGAICEEYAQKDGRIRVLHRENSGPSAARNMGIDWTLANTDCEWLCFIDSDDWVHPRLLEKLVEGTWQYPVNISICGYVETDGAVPQLPEDRDFSLWTPEEFYLHDSINVGMPVVKLFHKDCFTDIRFPVGKIHEDEMTIPRVLFAQKEIAYSSLPLYYYFDNQDSITKSRWTPRRLDSIEAFAMQVRFFREQGFQRAYEKAVVAYGYNLCVQRKHVQASGLGSADRKHYLRELNVLIKKAVKEYGAIYGRRSNLDIYCEIYPAVKPVYAGLQKIYRSIRRKGETS